MDALAISRADILWREGGYVEDPILPAQIGYEAAGVVDLTGPKVKTIRPGDRVSTFPAASLIEYAAHGEEIIYPESSLLVYPPNLNPEQAASANTALFLAYFALVELAGLQRGQYVVITAATASTGIAALQLAKRLGAKCIAITRSSSRKVELDSAGANHVIVVGEEDVRDAIFDLTDGLGADLIYDAVGGPWVGGAHLGNKAFGPDHCLWRPRERDRRDQDPPWGLLYSGREGLRWSNDFRFYR